MTDGEWERIWRINTMQQLWVARHLFPRWIAQGGGTLTRTRTRTRTPILTLGGSRGAAVTLSSQRRRQGCSPRWALLTLTLTLTLTSRT